MFIVWYGVLTCQDRLGIRSRDVKSGALKLQRPKYYLLLNV